jgi:glycerophosphoryl diester phosphodiesterase
MKNIRESFLCNTPIAHRGLHGAAPENSLAAFEAAIEKGYAIETDVRYTKDGTIVVMHDDNLKRLTGEEGKVRDTRWQDLKNMRLVGTNERIMTLDECLQAIDGRTPLLLEVKDMYTVREFPDVVVNKMKEYKGEYALQSFNPFYVHKFKRLAPEVMRGQLAMGIFSKDVLISCKDTLEEYDIDPEFFQTVGGLSNKQVKEAVAIVVEQSGFIDTHKHWKFDAWAVKTMIMNFITKPDFVSYCCYNLPYHRAKKKENRAVLAWTVRTQAQAEKVRPWVDNLIFEDFLPEKTF